MYPFLTFTTNFHKNLLFRDKRSRKCYVCQREHLKWLKLIEKSVMTGFELRYFGNTIRFSFFTTQFFPPTQKTAIPKHSIKKSFFLNRETKPILLLPLETISMQMCHVLREQFCCLCMYTKTARNTTISRNYASN